MIYPIQLIQEHGLQPADVVVVGRKGGLAAHYLVYMGWYQGHGHLFMANLEEGVSWLSLDYLQSRAHEFTLKRVRRFEGNANQRHQALRRAKSRKGEGYSLVRFNCEHFANYVQFGRESSRQVQVVGLGLLGLGVFALAAFLGSSSDQDERRRYS